MVGRNVQWPAAKPKLRQGYTMATVVWHPNPQFRAGSAGLKLGLGSVIDPMAILKVWAKTDAQTTTDFKVDYQTDGGTSASIDAHGSGFTYDGSGNVTGGTVTSFDIVDDRGNSFATFSNFSVLATTFYAAITNDNLTSLSGRYEYLTSLLNDTTQTGGTGNDGFETGSGNATITAAGSQNIVFEWQPGNLTYHGTGPDTLSFQAYWGPYPNEPATGALVNLATGTGTNPYGGTLTLAGIENVVGTDKADLFLGDDKRQRLRRRPLRRWRRQDQ